MSIKEHSLMSNSLYPSEGLVQLGITNMPDVDYRVKKIGAKTKHPTHPDEREIGTGKMYYALTVHGIKLLFTRGFGYTVTSPIVKVTPSETGYLVETENSLYLCTIVERI